MIPNQKKLSERDFTFKQDRLKWLDAEITRYRDFEWKATSFHTAVFVAILYLLFFLDPNKQHLLHDLRNIFIFTTGIYALIAVLQLFYIHISLNRCRNNRNDILTDLNQPCGKKIQRFFGFWEGLPGAIFPIGFIFSIVVLEVIVIWLLLTLG